MPNPAQIGTGPDKRVAIGLFVAIGACILHTSIRDPLEQQNRFDDKSMHTSFVDPEFAAAREKACLLYTSPSPRDRTRSRMPSSA